MGLFDHFDIEECGAIFKPGIVKGINESAYTLDVEIGQELVPDIPVHYHCEDGWKTHSHPHTDSEREQMMSAFDEDDQVLVLYDRDDPKRVIGFVKEPKECYVGEFPLFTQTYVVIDMQEGSGVVNTIRIGGEILGVGSGQKIGGMRDETMTFENLQDGKLHVNDIWINDNKWTHENWFAQTGWPYKWEVVYEFVAGTPISEGWPLVTIRVKSNNDADTYDFRPYHPRQCDYNESSLEYTQLQWIGIPDPVYVCQNESEINEVNGVYNLDWHRDQWAIMIHADMGGLGLFSSTMPDEASEEMLIRDDPLSYYRKGAMIEKYSIPCSSFWYQANPLFLDPPNYDRKNWSNRRFLSGQYIGQEQKQWLASGVNSWSGTWDDSIDDWLCDEDKGTLRPTLCDGQLVTPPKTEVPPVKQSEFKVIFDIEGSDLETIFVQRNYPLISRQFGYTINNVDSRVLF